MPGSILSGAAALQDSFANIGFGIANAVTNQQQYQQNREDAFQMAEDARNFQKEMTQQNRNWQLEDQIKAIQLANTETQRKAKDLQAAGINPLMAGGMGGATVTPPSGGNNASAPMGSAASPQPAGWDKLIGINAGKQFIEGLKTLAEVGKTESETAKNNAETAIIEIRADFEAERAREEINNLVKDTELKEAGRQLNYQEIKNKVQEIFESRARIIAMQAGSNNETAAIEAQKEWQKADIEIRRKLAEEQKKANEEIAEHNNVQEALGAGDIIAGVVSDGLRLIGLDFAASAVDRYRMKQYEKSQKDFKKAMNKAEKHNAKQKRKRK